MAHSAARTSSAASACFAAFIFSAGCGGDVRTTNDAGASTGGLRGWGGDVRIANDAGASAGGAAAGGAGNGARRVPSTHRAAALCTEPRAPGSPTGHANCPGIPAECVQDADCTAGTNGRCFSDTHGCTNVYCSYDGCQSDSDCAVDEACACRQPAAGSAPNSCVSAECHIDTDCGPGGFCSPSLVGNQCSCLSAALCKPNESSCSPGPCLCGDSCGHGYFCHTPKDSCLDDGDCAGGSAGPSTCNYDRLEKRWTCTAAVVCPL